MEHKKLHVLYIITKLELGGAQKVCLTLLDGIEKSGSNSILISGSEGELSKNFKNKKNVLFLETFQRELVSPFSEFKNFVKLTKKIKHIKKLYPDLIVHTHSSKAGIIGRWASRFAGVTKIIHTIHGYGFHPHQKKISWVVCFALEWITSLITSNFVCVSSYDVQVGVKFFPGFEKKYSIIRSAVEWKKFIISAEKILPFPQKEEPFVFGTTACFKPQKNLLDLFKSFEMVFRKNPNVKLEVIGDGIMRKDLEKYIKEKQLEGKIVLHGWQNDVSQIMKSWHTFTLTSLWEGLPCAIVEARLLHLPILAYDTGGIKDIIKNTQNGFLCKQGGWQEMADAMLKISTNQSLHKKMQTYKDNLDDFKNEKMVEHHINLYNQMSTER